MTEKINTYRKDMEYRIKNLLRLNNNDFFSNFIDKDSYVNKHAFLAKRLRFYIDL